MLYAFLKVLIPPAVMWAVSFIAGQTAAFFGAAGTQNLLYLTSAVDTVCILIFLLLIRNSGWYDSVQAPGRDRPLRAAGKLVFLFALGMICSVLSEQIFTRLGLFEQFSNSVQESLLAAPFPAQLAGLVILSPLCEELCYRHLGYSTLKKEINRPAAALLTSLLFAAGHGNMIQFLYALPMGLALCVCFEWGGGFWGAAVFHAGANLISVLLAAR